MSNATTDELLGLLRNLQGKSTEDTSQYRYVIYARKSTEGEERQIRSLADQIAECEKFAQNQGLNVLPDPISPIQEQQSAKEPDIRPKFRAMLEDIQKGKYEGIIAWHPDRLARNMKEAGEIIDLLDKKIIKDLQFPSFTFENNTAGKMLLGISFVLSKQYSDKLSDDVSRGVRRSILEGKYLSKAKHGYYRDRNMHLRPDNKPPNNNFLLMKSAWQMRLQNKSLDEIAEFLNKNQYQRTTGKGKIVYQDFKMRKQVLSEVFKDTFYTGVLQYGENQNTIVDLTTIYNFVPMVSVDEYLQINHLSNIKKAFRSKKRGLGTEIKADFLRGMVVCGHCCETMSSGITVKRHPKTKKIVTQYYFFRCDRPTCKIKVSGKKVNQNVRGKVILEYVYQFLDNNHFGTEAAYQHYVQEMKSVSQKEIKDLVRQEKSLQQTAHILSERIDSIKKYLPTETDAELILSYKGDLKSKLSDSRLLDTEIEKIKKLKERSKEAVYTLKEFIELMDNLPDTLRKTKQLQSKDKIIRRIFSNFTLKDKKVSSYQLNQPFKDFFEKGFVKNGRGDRTRTCDHSHPMRAF